MTKMKPSHVAASTAASLVLLILLLVSPSPCEATLACDQVVGYLQTCESYLQGGGDKPPPSCCDGAKALLHSVTSVEDKRTVCSCIKATAQIIKPKPENARDLPVKCGIRLPFEISPALDCSRIG